MVDVKTYPILAIFTLALLMQQDITAATKNDADVQLNQVQQEVIIDSLIEVIRNEYVEPKKAKEFIAALEASVKDGAYDQERLASSFIIATNQLLHAVYPDKHLGVLTAERFALMQEIFKSEQHQPNQHQGQPEQHQSNQHQRTQHSSAGILRALNKGVAV